MPLRLDTSFGVPRYVAGNVGLPFAANPLQAGGLGLNNLGALGLNNPGGLGFANPLALSGLNPAAFGALPIAGLGFGGLGLANPFGLNGLPLNLGNLLGLVNTTSNKVQTTDAGVSGSKSFI